MTSPLSAGAQKIQTALHTLGFTNTVVEFSAATRTAAEAAEAIGCTVAQIAKSLIFVAMPSNRPVLVIASGANRVNEKTLRQYLNEKPGKADAEFVRRHTGFVIGGVPPIGHATPLFTLIDEDLLHFETIWAAAGTPFAVFQLTPADLVKMTGGQVIRIK